MRILVLLACVHPAIGAPVYSGLIRIPAALAASDGRQIEPGFFTVSVTTSAQGWRLTFARKGEEKLVVAGIVRSHPAMSGLVPLAGTQFLRSSEDPLPTGQDRQFSRTGAAQYEEEKRDWKGVLRIYRAGQSRDVRILFQERAGAGSFTTVEFPLRMAQ